MADKLTRQGVRDLDAKLGKPKPKRPAPEEAPPAVQAQIDKHFCRHPKEARKREHLTGEEWCRACGQLWDWDGKPYR